MAALEERVTALELAFERETALLMQMAERLRALEEWRLQMHEANL